MDDRGSIERRNRGAALADQLVDIIHDELFGAEDDPAEAAALPVDVLGRRIHDAVGAELERPLVERGRKYVVDGQRRAGRMRDLGHRLDIDDFQRRVSRALQEKSLGVINGWLWKVIFALNLIFQQRY